MRKLATAAAVSLALASGGAFGLGLGEIEMRSALNQPMDAEIRLTAVKPGELDGMIVQLASEQAFARAGLERSTVLTDLTFSIDNSGPVPFIRIASGRPVVEPFLNFLLEVDWPQGRMVREYTVLLDPPVFMTPSATNRNATADQPALVQRGDDALVVPTPIERTVDPSAGVEVDLLSLDNDTGTPASDGEIVTLESLDGASPGGSGEVISLGDSEIVSLTDLEAPNTVAIEQREQAARESFDPNAIEVELVDSGAEIGDDAVIDTQSGELALQNTDASSDGSTIVSLDDLSPSPTASDNAGADSADNTEVTVSRGDTLFEIARNNQLPGVSVQQMMMALLAANESSFIDNNINLVRAGANLRIPDSEEASRLTQTQAIAAIGQQDQLWREYRDQIRGDADTRLAQAPDTSSSTATVANATQDSDEQIDEQGEEISTASLDADATDGLSAEARAILDNARDEILNRDELKIVADNAPGSTAASSTADETADTDAKQLGELNRKLQLAREELSSTRLQSEDLSDQAGELQSTTDNLDALVALRQNEVAQLEAQLADARTAEEAAALADSEALDTAEDAVADASDMADAADTDDMADSAADGAQDLVADASTAMSNAADGAGESAEEIGETGKNALTEAGETLSEVELLDEDAENPENTEAAGATEPPVRQTTWYEDFLNDPKRMMIAGIGAIGLLGVLGTLLFRRKRRDDDDDSMLDFEDDAEFIDEGESADLQSEGHSQAEQADSEGKGLSGAGAAAGMAAAGTAAVGGVMASGASEKDHLDDTFSSTGAFDDMADTSQEFGSETQAVADSTSDDTLDKDDTISEVDVYLAYGLHGQAEELLTKAIERKPNQPEYLHKLLQTYHAQGNAEGFHQAAGDFHARFGGESNPDWAGIAAMGDELRPGDPMYAGGAVAVSAIGSGDSFGSKFDDNDFLPAQDGDSGSISRGFDSSDAADLHDEDGSEMRDQNLDPAFAFDEADLEATGDFSEIANELSGQSDDGGIEFSDYSDEPGIDMDATLSEALDDNDTSALGNALTMDELDGIDGMSTPGDDLTLDLDQLSGDLELDTAELLDSDLTDLEMSGIAAENGLLSEGVSADGNNADEMDTMLDLAKAYIDMGDKDSASSALDEIVKSGSPAQVNEAETLLRNIS